MEKLSHEEMMNRAWQFIGAVSITDDVDTKDEANYFVKNIYEVRDAYYADLESGYYREGEDVVSFLNRHCIEWE